LFQNALTPDLQNGVYAAGVNNDEPSGLGVLFPNLPFQLALVIFVFLKNTFPIISKTKLMVGLPGFEPESIEPKSTSLDQASREPQTIVAEKIISHAQ
jgi:hypothetical protein